MSFHLLRNGNHSTIRHAIGRAHILAVYLLSGVLKSEVVNIGVEY